MGKPSLRPAIALCSVDHSSSCMPIVGVFNVPGQEVTRDLSILRMVKEQGLQRGVICLARARRVNCGYRQLADGLRLFASEWVAYVGVPGLALCRGIEPMDDEVVG